MDMFPNFLHIGVAKAASSWLMTLKYARMNNQIPRLNPNRLIDKIVNIETELLQKFKEKYPHLVRNIGTGTYLRSELETYSDKTLELYYTKELYYTNLLRARKAGRNLVEETYISIFISIFKKLGYSSLEEAEEKQKYS